MRMAGVKYCAPCLEQSDSTLPWPTNTTRSQPDMLGFTHSEPYRFEIEFSSTTKVSGTVLRVRTVDWGLEMDRNLER